MSNREASGDGSETVDRRELLSQQFEAEGEEIKHGPSEEVPIARIEDHGDKPRAADGKFVKTEHSEAKPPVVAGAIEVHEPPVWERAPKSWKPEKHDLWAKMDPQAREYAYQREEQMRAGVEPLLPKAQLADRITQVAEPYMNTVRGLGIDLPTAVEGLMKADHQLRTLPQDQKLAYLTQLAQSYGINLGQAQTQPGQQPQGQGQYADPNYYRLMNDFNTLRGEVVSFRQAQETQQNQAYLGEINQFAQTAEYFEEARPTMISLLNQGIAKSLPEAYEKAIRLDDELFGRQQAAIQSAAEKVRRETANRAVGTARAAAVSVKTSTPGKTAPNAAQTRRAMLSEALDNIDARL